MLQLSFGAGVWLELGWSLVGAEVGIATVALVSGWVLLGMGDEALTLISIRGGRGVGFSILKVTWEYGM